MPMSRQVRKIREPGSPTGIRRPFLIPNERGSLELVRVQTLFHVLLHTQGIGEEAGAAFTAYIDACLPNYDEESHRLGVQFIKDYLKVDNPTLLPILRKIAYYQGLLAEQGVEAASMRLEWVADDPSPLGRPSTRGGRDYYRGPQERKKAMVESGAWQTVDQGELIRFSEGWIEVKHEFVPSLTRFVAGQEVRKYTKQDIDDPQFSTRHRKWQRVFKEINDALNFRDWPSISR